MVFSGALERHPGLKLVLAESGVGWLPVLLDSDGPGVAESSRATSTTHRAIPPTELFQRQVIATFEEEELAVQFYPAPRCRLMYVGVGLSPHRQHVSGVATGHQRRLWARCRQTIAAKITALNCAELYRFEQVAKIGTSWRRRRMSADLVIRGGTVFDGSGGSGRRLPMWRSRGVSSTRSARALDGKVELDASGCAVAPGFIDIHTHYDAQVFWDPELKPSVVSRGHHRRGWQLRLHDRPLPPRAPRRDRAHVGKCGRHECQFTGGGHCLGVRDLPGLPRLWSAVEERRSISRPISVTPLCGST